MQFNNQVFGVSCSGGLDRQKLLLILARLPAGITEIYLHPATVESYAGSAPGYRYVDEFRALMDARVIAAVRERDVVLGGFADFA